MLYTKPTARPIRLLLADDDAPTLEMMNFAARYEGFETVCVTTAQGIIDAVNEAQEDFDAIISDVNFLNDNTVTRPRLTGIAAIRQIRKARGDIPVLFITGYTNNILREEARRVDAQMLAKPINPNAIFGDKFRGEVGLVHKLIDWHRKATHADYDGEERRVNSINRTDHRRRSSDQRVESPRLLKEIIQEVRQEEEKLCAVKNTII